MSISGNSAALEIAPDASGIYGIEVDIAAQASDGTLIDRAAFLSIETQPASQQIFYTRWWVGAGVVLLLVVIIFALQLRKKRTS
jgi:hypothetical protein